MQRNAEGEGKHLGLFTLNRALLWFMGFDAKARKLGEQKGLDTPVVLAVNDAR